MLVNELFMSPIAVHLAAFPHMSVYMCGCLCNGVRASLLLLQPLQSTESRLAVYASYWKHCAAAVQQRHVVVASLGCCIQARCCRAVQAESTSRVECISQLSATQPSRAYARPAHEHCADPSGMHRALLGTHTACSMSWDGFMPPMDPRQADKPATMRCCLHHSGSI